MRGLKSIGSTGRAAMARAAGILVVGTLAFTAAIGALGANAPDTLASDPTIGPLPCPMYEGPTRCCNDHDCLSSYPRYVRVSTDGAEDLASENPGGIEPPYTPYDEGIPDPVDELTDDGGDSAPAIAPALEQAGIDMSQVTIVDENAAVIEAAAAAGFQDCPRHYTCFWQHVHFRGRAYFARAGSDGYVWRNLRDFGLSDAISSWRNRRGYVTSLARDTDGDGPRLCLARFSHNPRMFYMNDKASSFRLTTAGVCGSS
jgi:hypothetical protein